MPENVNTISLDDEDILDLTEIAEAGSGTEAKKGVAPAASPEVDFTADLDALLDSLSAGQSPSETLGLAPETRAAPIADATPVAHEVDPHETMALPNTADVDSLLEELTASPRKDAPTGAPALNWGEDEDTPAVPPRTEAEAAAGFDAILAQARAAEANKRAEEEAAPVRTEKTQGGQKDDDINLQELDALLDDILAAAPVSAAPAPAKAAQERGAPAGAMQPATAQTGAGDAAARDLPPAAMPAETPLMQQIMRLEETVNALEEANKAKDEAAALDAIVEAKFDSLLGEDSPLISYCLAAANIDGRVTACLEDQLASEALTERVVASAKLDSLVESKQEALASRLDEKIDVAVDGRLAQILTEASPLRDSLSAHIEHVVDERIDALFGEGSALNARLTQQIETVVNARIEALFVEIANISNEVDRLVSQQLQTMQAEDSPLMALVDGKLAAFAESLHQQTPPEPARPDNAAIESLVEEGVRSLLTPGSALAAELAASGLSSLLQQNSPEGAPLRAGLEKMAAAAAAKVIREEIAALMADE